MCHDKQGPKTVCVGVHSYLSVLMPTCPPATDEVALIGTQYLWPCPLDLAFCRKTEGYSCSDLTSLARDAAFGPIRGTPHTGCWAVVLIVYVHVVCVCVCVRVCEGEGEGWRLCMCACMSHCMWHSGVLSIHVQI